jgi:hypothetical protein
MKLKGNPILLRTIIGQVEHKGKVYEVAFEEIGKEENDFKVWLLDGDGFRFSEETNSSLVEKLVEFFLIETEDIEQFN